MARWRRRAIAQRARSSRRCSAKGKRKRDEEDPPALNMSAAQRTHIGSTTCGSVQCQGSQEDLTNSVLMDDGWFFVRVDTKVAVVVSQSHNRRNKLSRFYQLITLARDYVVAICTLWRRIKETERSINLRIIATANARVILVAREEVR